MRPSPANLILTLFCARWLAGIAENFGLPHASELTTLTALALLCSAFLLRPLVARESSSLVLALLLLCVCAAMSLAASPLAATGPALKFIALIGFYALLANALFASADDQIDLRRAQTVLAGFLILGGLLSVQQVVSGQGFFDPGKPDVMRAIGSDVHPVSFAIQCVAAMAAMELARLKNSDRRRAIWWAAMALGLAGIYLTFARTAWLMAGLVGGIVLMRRPSPLRLLFLLAALILGGLVLARSGRMQDLASLPAFLSDLDLSNIVFDPRRIDNSANWRIVNWALGLHQALTRPLFGHGAGMSAELGPFGLEMHNIALEFFFEMGAFGLAAGAFIAAALLRLHRRMPRDAGQAIAGAFGLSLAAAVTFSTSMIDQTMGLWLYLLILRIGRLPARPGAAATARLQTGEGPCHGSSGISPIMCGATLAPNPPTRPGRDQAETGAAAAGAWATQPRHAARS